MHNVAQQFYNSRLPKVKYMHLPFIGPMKRLVITHTVPISVQSKNWDPICSFNHTEQYNTDYLS